MFYRFPSPPGMAGCATHATLLLAARMNDVDKCVRLYLSGGLQPAEDLILEGSERSVIRVRAGTPYSCLMLKNQRFSSLFRHYAKHHGLRKDDLAYYFTEELQNEDTPETVFLLVSFSRYKLEKRHNKMYPSDDAQGLAAAKLAGLYPRGQTRTIRPLCPRFYARSLLLLLFYCLWSCAVRLKVF